MAAIPCGVNSAEVAAAGVLLGKIDAVDKLAKVTMNAAKVVSEVSTDSDTSKQAADVGKTFQDGRSMMRMGQWVRNSQNLQKAIDGYSAASGDAKSKKLIEVLRHASNLGYVLGDNIAFLAKQGVLARDADPSALASKRFQLAMFSTDAILTSMNLRSNPSPRLQQQLVRNISDILMVLNRTKLVPSYDANVPSWFPAACGLVSGSIAVKHMVDDAVKEEKQKRQ
eukprot:TRINITY_DN2320_c0_g2_i2.p1 TRINITY_DN2320_c0_g2~~TRINITY_DN2320_c0_g2_i2.p1  ORF type:complete len:240 (+),score=66.63 TRINITY_DN2320_c0_g2_i2:48-722(+)